jgi:hypothetical protein
VGKGARVFDFTASSLIASLLWGAVGTGFFIYGKKQQSWIPLCGGLLMGSLSYFVGSAAMMSLACGLILVIMYILKRQGY